MSDPNIPSLPSSIPADQVKFFQSLKSAITVLMGQDRTPEIERAARIKDFQKLGFDMDKFLNTTSREPYLTVPETIYDLSDITDAAMQAVEDMEDDGVLSVAEKATWRNEWINMMANYDSLIATATALSVPTTALVNAKTDLYNYLVAAGVWSDQDEAYTISGTDLTDKTAAYYDAFEDLGQACPTAYTQSWSAEGADVTQEILDLGADIEHAKVDGTTLIDGGYIRASLLHTDVLLVGDVGDLAYLSTVGDSQVTTISGGKIVSGSIVGTTSAKLKISLDYNYLFFGEDLGFLYFGAIPVTGSTSGTRMYGHEEGLRIDCYDHRSTAASPYFSIRRGNSGGISMHSGGYSTYYNDIWLNAEGDFDIRSEYQDITLDADVDIDLIAGDDILLQFGDNLTFKGNGTGDEIQFIPNGATADGMWMTYDGTDTCFYPYTNNTNKVGISTRVLKEVHSTKFYGSEFWDDGSQILPDTLDDLSIIRKIKQRSLVR